MTLDPVDYWKLRVLTTEVERDQIALEWARHRRQAAWAELAAKYGLDPVKHYRASDEDCSLVEV